MAKLTFYYNYGNIEQRLTSEDYHVFVVIKTFCMKKIFIVKFISVVCLLAVGVTTVPVMNAHAEQKTDRIAGQYIVVLKDSAVDSDVVADDLEQTYGLGVKQKYGHALKGFTATVPAAQLKMLESDSRVAFVVEDRIVSIVATQVKVSGGRPVTQPAQIIPTGVKRIGAFGTGQTGAGVGVAVIDTGIDLTHPDLKANISNQSKTCVVGTLNANDDNGHGTHVAGTIAAANNTIGVLGVAPSAKLYSVKVLDRYGSGSWSSVICGIDWVTAHASTIKVASMSLAGAGTSDNNCGVTNNDPLHQAICKSVAAGVTYVVAAGNNAADSTNFVPAAYDDAVITVSALADSDGRASGLGGVTDYGADDTFATFSNFGSPVDIAAPGVAIYSTWKGGTYNTISGTSMATPHVSGAAALYIAAHPGALWTTVREGLKSAGEVLGAGHTDPSGLHSEALLKVVTF